MRKELASIEVKSDGVMYTKGALSHVLIRFGGYRVLSDVQELVDTLNAAGLYLTPYTYGQHDAPHQTLFVFPLLENKIKPGSDSLTASLAIIQIRTKILTEAAV